MTDIVTDEQLVFNGINGATGEYLLAPMTPAELSQEICDSKQNKKQDKEHLDDLEELRKRTDPKKFAPIAGVDPKKLEETGWGVVFAKDTDEKVKKALGVLLEHRKAQARNYYKVLEYQPNQTKQEFLRRWGADTTGPADPEKVPYYLLLVGDPQEIPYRFQYQLDVAYAVGRLHFPTPEEYAQYARSVVAAETSNFALPRRAAFVGVCNDNDRATFLSSSQLVQPLADYVTNKRQNAPDGEVSPLSFPDWKVETLVGNGAGKANLQKLMGGAQPPALLFTASHGMGFSDGDPHQLSHQGALICQDWPGPQRRQEGKVQREHYLSADDITDDANLLGLIAFHFACYGAGTPQLDDFPHRTSNGPTAIAPHPFVARLPQRMLGHPDGGALAVLGHVERAWGCSFVSDMAGPQLAAYKSTLTQLLEGYPVGAAFEYFNQRYSELSSDLSERLEIFNDPDYTPDDHDRVELGKRWTANNDARSFVILGDPAVRLQVAAAGEPVTERPSIKLIMPLPNETEPKKPPEPEKPHTVPDEPKPASVRNAGGTPPQVATPSAPLMPVQSPITVMVTIGGQTTPAVSSVSAPAPESAPESGEDEDFSVAGDTIKKVFGTASKEASDLKENVSTALGKFTEDLSVALQEFVQNISQLEVTTYVSDKMETGQSKDDLFAGAHLRAVTRIKLDGDTEICVPTTEDGVDDALWAIHVAMVQQAQAHRTELLKTAVSAASGLAQVIKIL